MVIDFFLNSNYPSLTGAPIPDEITDTRDKIDQFISAKNLSANGREKYKNKISFDYFADEVGGERRSGAVGAENSQALLNRIVIIQKIENILDSMDLEELLELVESQALSHRPKGVEVVRVHGNEGPARTR